MIKKAFVLFLAICLQSLVKAEVVELTRHDNPHNHYTIQNREGFIGLLNDIHYWDSHQSKFSDYVDGFLPHDGQMPGFSAFLPVAGVEHVQVFAAKKRNPINFPEHPIPEYNFLYILDADQNIVPNLNAFHTERQLVSHILRNQPQDIQGNFLIFTQSQPCPNPGNDNGFMSCYEFYLDLAHHFQNIEFHIYIDRRFDINTSRVVPLHQQGNHQNQKYVQRFVQLMEFILGHIQEGNQIGGVQIHQGELRVQVNLNQWANVAQNSDMGIKRRFINFINTALGAHPNDWQGLKEAIINGRYSGNDDGNHDRIHYHVR